MWLPYARMLVPIRPEWWPPLTGQVAQNAPEYSSILSRMDLGSRINPYYYGALVGKFRLDLVYIWMWYKILTWGDYI